MSLTLILLAGAVLSLAAAPLLYRSRRHLEASERLLGSVAFFCGYAALLVVACGLYAAPVTSWNAARLAPLLGWMGGVELYSTEAEGSIQTTMYPPFSALAYVPAAIANHPLWAVSIGAILAQAYYLVPLGVACIRTGASKGLSFFVLFALVYWSRQSEGLWQSQSWVHADAPALGLGLLACVAVFHDTENESSRGLYLAAVAACLSVWTKQVAIGILPALALWLLWVRGLRKCAVFVAWSVVCGGILAVISVLLFSVEGMWFNLLVIPANVGWVGRVPYNLIRALTELLHEALVPLGVLIGGGLYSRWHAAEQDSWRDWARRQPWVLPALVGVFNIPVSVLGRVKEGGLENNLSFSLYFWIAAMGLFVLSHHQVIEREGQAYAARYRIVVTALTVWLALLSLPQSLRPFLTLLPPENYGSQITYEAIRREPGRFYFPDYPLSHLLAGDTLTHFSSAVGDRERRAGIPVSANQMRSHIPQGFELLCIDVGNYAASLVAMRDRHFAEYTRQTDHFSDSGFQCYAANSEAR